MSGWRSRACRLVFALAFLALLGACSPASRLRVRVLLPSGAKPPLHVTGAKACPPAPISPPLPGTTPGDAYHVTQERDGGAVVVTAAFRGRHCSANITVWIDSDGDGKPSSGDYVGTSALVEIVDRGIVSGNLTRGPDLVLGRVP
jgi:hypothetical protein